MKIYAGDLKDINDVKGVLAVSGRKLDLALLKKLTAKFGPDSAKKLEHILKDE